MNYVYYFTNYKGEIIYVGKTGNIKTRMRNHFLNGHLPKECYESVDHIFYADVGVSKYDAEIIETIFINKYKPIYNTEKMYPENYDKTTYRAPDLKWKEIFITYSTNSVDISYIKPEYQCFNSKLTPTERTNSIIEYNLLLIQKKPGIFQHYLKEEIKIHEKLLNVLYDFLLKIELIPEESSYDEPLSVEENNAAYAAFYTNKEYIEEIKILLETNLIFKLTNEIYAVPLYNKGTFEYIESEIYMKFLK